MCANGFVLQLFHFYYFFKEKVKLSHVHVDCKSIKLLPGQPKIFKKVVRACKVRHCQRDLL